MPATRPETIKARAIKARNKYRIKVGIPLELPVVGARGTHLPEGQTKGRTITMHLDAWRILDRVRGKHRPGHWLTAALRDLEKRLPPCSSSSS